jgi:hypothetical protein
MILRTRSDAPFVRSPNHCAPALGLPLQPAPGEWDHIGAEASEAGLGDALIAADRPSGPRR